MADQFIYLCGLVRILVDAAEVGSGTEASCLLYILTVLMIPLHLSEQLFCDHHLR